MSKPKQKTVTVNGMSATVDAKLAPLLKEIWNLEIDVIGMSTEAEDNKIAVLFSTAVDAENFFEFLCPKESQEPTSLYQKLQNASKEEDSEWHVMPHLDQETCEECGSVHYSFDVMFLFPQTDLSAIVLQLRKAAKKLAEDGEFEHEGPKPISLQNLN